MEYLKLSAMDLYFAYIYVTRLTVSTLLQTAFLACSNWTTISKPTWSNASYKSILVIVIKPSIKLIAFLPAVSLYMYEKYI